LDIGGWVTSGCGQSTDKYCRTWPNSLNIDIALVKNLGLWGSGLLVCLLTHWIWDADHGIPIT